MEQRTTSTEVPESHPGPSVEGILRGIFRIIVAVAIAGMITFAILAAIAAFAAPPRPGGLPHPQTILDRNASSSWWTLQDIEEAKAQVPPEDGS